MRDDETLPDRVRRRYNLLSPSQRTVARYCVTQPDRAGHLTAMRIADELSVSESTVVRFAVKIGYRGFPDMQASIRAASAVQADRARPTPHGNLTGRALESLQNDLEALEQSISRLDLGMLAAASDALFEARRIFVCGFRTSFSLAYLAQFHMRNVHSGTVLLGDIGGTLVDDLELITSHDAVLAFTFPVYDDRTISVIERAVGQKARTVVVTDSAMAPIPIDPLVFPLLVRHDSESFFNSNVPATAVVNALAVRLVELATANDPSLEEHVTERFHQKGKET